MLMVRKVSEGDRIKIEGQVSRVWPDGRVSIWLRSLGYPITVHPDVLAEITPGPKEKPQRRPPKFYDNPEREE